MFSSFKLADCMTSNLSGSSSARSFNLKVALCFASSPKKKKPLLCVNGYSSVAKGPDVFETNVFAVMVCEIRLMKPEMNIFVFAFLFLVLTYGIDVVSKLQHFNFIRPTALLFGW